MIQMRFYIDPETGYPHIYGHGVSEYEVEDVLNGDNEARRGSGGARIATGQTRDGRYVSVVYKPDENQDSVFVITAYPVTGRKRRASHRRRMRRRNR